MRLSIFGMGYVGCVSAACFATRGHEVVGVDVNRTKVDIINDSRSPIVEPGIDRFDQLISPIVEPGIDQLIKAAVTTTKLRATTDATEAVLGSDVSLVCVGTPSNHNGSLDISNVKQACQQIAEALAAKSRYHVVVVRSTT